VNLDLLVRCNNIYAERGKVDGALLISGSSIKAVLQAGDPVPKGVKTLDYPGLNVLPGIIDCHNHGYAGWSAFSHEAAEYASLQQSLASIGVTGVFPTVGADLENVEACAAAMELPSRGAEILGINMEGPFLNLPGAADKALLSAPDIELTRKIVRTAKGKLRLMTIAPELEGAREVVEFLAGEGVVVCGGHTNATAAQFRDAIGWGVSVATHTGNAMRGIHHREIGALGAALTDDRVRCELIADFNHVCQDMIELMLKIKPVGKIHLVSDSTQISGAEPGSYEFLGTTVRVGESGLVQLADGTLAGSGRGVIYGMKNLVKKSGIDISVASTMASLNPAVALGIDDRKGSIAPGKDADFIVLDSDFNVISTFVRGTQVFDSGAESIFPNSNLKFLRVRGEQEERI
jgi:N-acetylglucosamine-6-phosphate deacetylase